MSAAFLIARRELGAYLRTMSGYVIVAVMLVLSGLLFNAYAMRGAGKLSGEVLTEFFYFTSGITLVGSVFLSMRLFAEERQTGTLVLLLSAPVRDAEVVVGKYLSALVFLGLYLVVTAYMPALVWWYGKVSWGHVACGYVGLFLVGSSGLAVGTFGSALTRSQVVAAVVSGMLCLLLTVCWLAAAVTDPPLTGVVMGIAWFSHFKPFSEGVLQLTHVAYFILLTWAALFGATRVLEGRRWT